MFPEPEAGVAERPTTSLRVRRRSDDKPLPPGATYVDWDRMYPRERAERRYRHEHIQAPDGRTGEAEEWEETVYYRPEWREVTQPRPSPGWDEVRSTVRSIFVVAGLFVVVAVGWDTIGGPLWSWLALWLGLSLWFT